MTGPSKLKIGLWLSHSIKITIRSITCLKGQHACIQSQYYSFHLSSKISIDIVHMFYSIYIVIFLFSNPKFFYFLRRFQINVIDWYIPDIIVFIFTIFCLIPRLTGRIFISPSKILSLLDYNRISTKFVKSLKANRMRSHYLEL